MKKRTSKFGLYKSEVKNTDYLVSSFVQPIVNNLPSKVDWRPEMSSVKNQGSEGSCAGHSGVAIKEWMEFKDYGMRINLSERYLYENAKKISGDNEGTTLVAIAKVLIDKGVCEELYWKYVSGKVGYPLPGADENASQYKIEPIYTRIVTEQELKACLVKSPVNIGVKIYKNWDRIKINGIIPNPTICEKIKRTLGGHAIILCGYNENTKLYTFKNSWGTNWGDKGYGHISFKEMKRILMDAIYMIDITDPNEWQEMKKNIKTVADLPRSQRRTLRK